MELTFLGGAGTVTGSRALVGHGGTQLLVDCGLFQGFKHLRLLNRRPIPADVGRLDAVVLTHAHLDHSGAIPLLHRQGLRAPVLTTPASASLCRILWADAARLQGEDTERANRKGYSRHHPAEALYTTQEATMASDRLRYLGWDEPERRGEATITLRRSGHILGASSALIELGGARVLFSGDVGRPNDPLHGPPARLPAVDLLVMESTYGDRLHDHGDVEEVLGEIVRTTVARGGHVLAPVFAVGRAQRLLYHLGRLRDRGDIPDVPIYLNSPMANDAMDAFLAHPEAHGLSAEEADRLARVPIVVATREESARLNERRSPAIILAGSGMATGGRILHHLVAFGSQDRHTILLSGFQAGGTRGDRLQRGERELKIFGQYIAIRAEVRTLHHLSAHADADELIAWVKGAEAPPGRIVLNHGEPTASDALRLRVEEEIGVPCEVPMHGEAVAL
ncbi:MAG TPA: MBL fold metallo-hydrolase [Myxococcota bacterium]|nr:MBL fold metallo-hydrolase [Myxococcota bacterium]